MSPRVFPLPGSTAVRLRTVHSGARLSREPSLHGGRRGSNLLLGAYGALSRQIKLGMVTIHNRHEMLDLVMVDGKARGIIARDLVSGKLERHFGHAVVMATGGYGNAFLSLHKCDGIKRQCLLADI